MGFTIVSEVTKCSECGKAIKVGDYALIIQASIVAKIREQEASNYDLPLNTKVILEEDMLEEIIVHYGCSFNILHAYYTPK